ncbi:DUF551 domain-containing protein [Yersinia enterocolitica]
MNNIEELREHCEEMMATSPLRYAYIPASSIITLIERIEKAEAELSAANERCGWIKCSDQMPEENDRILIFSDGAFVLLARYVCGEFYDVVSNGDEFFETVSRCVSHWMPLPTAPLVEGNADAE